MFRVEGEYGIRFKTEKIDFLKKAIESTPVIPKRETIKKEK